MLVISRTNNSNLNWILIIETKVNNIYIRKAY